MLADSHFEQVRKIFSDQFTRFPDGWVYRRGQKGPQIPVSEDERDRFVASFNKRLRYVVWLTIVAVVAFVAILVWLLPDINSAEGQAAMWACIIVTATSYMALYYWIWSAPSRELTGRAPVGPAMNLTDARALGFSKLTYGQLASAALMGVLLVWRESAKVDVLHGWGRLWLALAGMLIVLSSVQAIRKWRLGRQSASGS